jgi:hypothetical protein
VSGRPSGYTQALSAPPPSARGAAAAAAGALLRIEGFDADRVLELRLLEV